MVSASVAFHAISRGDLSLGVPASFLARGSIDQSPQRQRIYVRGLEEGRNSGLLSGRGAHSVWLRELANIVASRGHSRWCPTYLQSEQALLNVTAGVTRQQCSVSFGWQPTNDLTSLPVDLWRLGRDAESVLGVSGGKDVGTSGAGAVPLKSAQMMRQQKNTNKTKNGFEPVSWTYCLSVSTSRTVEVALLCEPQPPFPYTALWV